MSDVERPNVPITIEDEMRRSYMDYAMSVIIGRALPDVRDGLKPAHRRVIYGMRTMGLASNRAYRKCAKIVGEVMGNFHPHGDASIYDTLVRLAQGFNMRYPLVDGQGNFGSVDGDPPRGHALHGSEAAGAVGRPDGRPRSRDGRFRAELRRDDRGAVGPPRAVPEPAGERLRRHCRRHGDEHPAAQPARGDRRHRLGCRTSRRTQAGQGAGAAQPDSRARTSPPAGSSSDGPASSRPT